ncbi:MULTISPECIES: class I SAM-dependent methyltransferase [unclassified Crossiella]|uniref:class I SAM-dependent methyltransferase n=1 Tax=unclassified Crossiella TaxID=2620835 RepID=UPI001FFF243C|nr:MULTISPECIES: class I SAM-dependent methyltransferase [unclassified Crossiella]MCK2244802.1 methyltransferase domain-containing protein [Crossiella sp. S99.2]MCK2258444.1 methyltransferase domain-containing protein [Crossiella sp. S99.1]
MKPYWNTNVARHPDILRAVPADCREALDIGCGDGLLARKLTAKAKRVTGIDSSPRMIALARELAADHPDLDFIEDDFRTADLPAAGYDFICSVATIHHVDLAPALLRLRDLLRPGGTLVVVALARSETLGERTFAAAVTPIVWSLKRLRRAHSPEGMPGAEARLSYGQVRATAERLLPGVRYRRHILRRYSLAWTKPG